MEYQLPQEGQECSRSLSKAGGRDIVKAFLYIVYLYDFWSVAA